MKTMKLAVHQSTNKIIHIDQAKNGLRCGSICEECREALEARQGSVRDWHFKHHKNTNCSGGQESALHKLGKQILLDHFQVFLPTYGKIEYSNAFVEKQLSNDVIPDVTAKFGESWIYFEIVVTHPVSPEKKGFYYTGRHNCIEINLRHCQEYSYDELKQWILNEAASKEIINWVVDEEKIEIKPVPKSDEIELMKLMLYGFCLLLIYLGLKRIFVALKPSPHPRNFHNKRRGTRNFHH